MKLLRKQPGPDWLDYEIQGARRVAELHTNTIADLVALLVSKDVLTMEEAMKLGSPRKEES